MSATIYWTAVKNGTSLKNVGAPSEVIGNLEKVFGGFPLTLTKEDIIKLQVLADLEGGREDDNPYRELIDVIERTGSIDVWAEY